MHLQPGCAYSMIKKHSLVVDWVWVRRHALIAIGAASLLHFLEHSLGVITWPVILRPGSVPVVVCRVQGHQLVSICLANQQGQHALLSGSLL